MKRKVVKTGSSLVVTLPREVVAEFKLEPGDEVDVSVHPPTSAIMRFAAGARSSRRRPARR